MITRLKIHSYEKYLINMKTNTLCDNSYICTPDVNSYMGIFIVHRKYIVRERRIII